MEKLCVKEFLRLNPPSEDDPVSDDKRIREALSVLGYAPVSIPVHVIRKIYTFCRNSGFEITVTMVNGDWEWNFWERSI